MNTSKTLSRSATKQHSATVAKYLVQKAAFFGTAKKILSITEDSIYIDSLNNDPKQHEEIPLQDILSIQISPTYEAEFSIINRKTEANQIFCANRTRCISDIYIAIDRYQRREAPSHAKSLTDFEVLKIVVPDMNELYMESTLVISRVHLEIIHKSLNVPPNLKKDVIEMKNPNTVVNSTTVIPFYSIGRIYKTHKGLTIEMKYSQAHHRLLIYDLEKTNSIINKIQQNYKESIGRHIPISTEDHENADAPEIVKPKAMRLFFYNAKVYKVIESGHFVPIEMAISDDYLVEYDIYTGVVIQKFELSAVKHVVRMMGTLAGIQVLFDDLTTVTYVPLRENRGLLASTIFTLAGWKRAENESTIQDDFIHGVMPRHNMAIHAWVNGDPEVDYEVELIKRFIEPKSEEDLYQGLHEFNENAKLKFYAESDPRPLQNLITLFCKNSKIFLTQEFMAFWEVYQIYSSSLYPYNFPEKPQTESERQQTLAECEEKFKQMSDKFQSKHGDKNFVLNTQTAPQLMYKTEELLKGIIILISSGKLFREIATNKTDQKRYETFLVDAAHLIDSPFSTLSHLAGNFYRALCKFPTLLERKSESANKKFVLTSKVKLIQTISETLAKRVLIKHEDAIVGNQHESQFILSILACLRILKTFVADRKDTTNPEDFQMILQFLSTPYYFAMFNFLSRYRSISCVYDTTIIVNSFFQHCTSRELYKSYQEKFVNNSTLILLHIKLALSSLSVLQRKISVVLLSHLFYENPNACGLICRIFPKNLFRKVDFTSTDISKWTFTQWEQFFSLVSKSFDTPTEQWTEECREELVIKLQKIDDEINSKFNYCPANRLHELFDPTFNHNGEFLLNIRWNHEEFEMKYDVLESKILVWKYYLRNLLEDSENPKFTIPITNPAKLWNELNIRFTGTNDDNEMRLILKVMVLLYREQYAQIKDLNTMQYWLRCLLGPEYRGCRHLILQLFYTALSVDDISVLRASIKKFVDIGGLKIIADVLSSLYFSDDHNQITGQVLEELKAKPPADMDYNYTKLDIKIPAYTYSLEKSAMIKIIVNIYKSILYRPIDKTLILDGKLLYPIPVAKYEIIEPNVIKSMINILLLKDDDIVSEVLNFFTEYLCDKFTFKSQTEDTPLYEFLLYNVTSQTAANRFKLAYKIYQRILEDLPADQNYIQAYTSFSFTEITPELQENAFEQYPLLRYLPKHMIWRLINVGVDDAVNIFLSDNYETPELIWNVEMRENLNQFISTQIAGYRKMVIRLAEKNEIYTKEQVPKYNDGRAQVVYRNILDEVSVGPLRLRVWIKKEFRNYELAPESVPIFVESLSGLLQKYSNKSISELTSKESNDLLIILKAHAKAIKTYSLNKYNCFREVIRILDHFTARLVQEDFAAQSAESQSEVSSFILVLCRVLYHAIKIERSENPNTFLEAGGIEKILTLLRNMLTKIQTAPRSEQEDYYTDLSLTYNELKILNLTALILRRMFACYPSQFIVFEAEKKLRIFLDLQLVSKVPLILFELFRTQSEKLKNEKDEQAKANEIQPIPEEGEKEQFQPHLASIFDVIVSENNSAIAETFIQKTFTLMRNLTDLLTDFSLKVDFNTAFIQSGLSWRFLEFLTYYGEANPARSESTNKLLENLCNVFRNNVIFSNEAYIWKLTGGFTSRGIGIITSKEKSSKLTQALNKLESPEKLILASFHDCVMNVLGKHILQLLLMDYFEPVSTPEDKCKSNILAFLKVYSTSLQDPATLWTNETRQELKNLLINQIFDINNSHGKSYLNLVENFKYSLHMKQLIINEIFISLYNKSPEWKLVNPPQFLLKTMRSISDLWQNLHELNRDPELANKKSELSLVLFNLSEATIAISKVISHHGFEDVLLSEESLTQLGFLLSDKKLDRVNPSDLTDLKSTCLDIFGTLCKKLSGSLKILENASILQALIELLRNNTKESSILNQKIVKVIEKIADEDSFRRALINYGFFVFILESCLKTELHPAIYRKDAFAFVVRVIKNLQVNHLLNKLILTLFPPHVQEKIYGNQKSDDVLIMLDTGYDTPKSMWTQLMRHEVLLLLTIEADQIENNWRKFEAKEIRITDNFMFWTELYNKMSPVFPELEENLCVDDIFLKNFNKEPKFEPEDNVAVFIDDLATRTSEIYNEFLQKTIAYEQTRATPNLVSMSVEDQKQLDKLSCQMVQLLTSLLLSLDNFMSGIKLREEKESIHQILGERSAKQSMAGGNIQEAVLISENALSLIVKCTELFDHLAVHNHILSTELQLIFLIVDNDRGFGLLKSNEIITTLAKLLRVITQADQLRNPFTFVEETLILAILMKVVLKDPMLALDAMDPCFKPLKELLTGSKYYLKKLAENIVSILARNPKQGKEFFTDLNKDGEIISVAVIHNCTPAVVLQSIWKPLSNPVESNSTLNLVAENGPDTAVKFPVISDLSLRSIPHPKGENLKVEQNVKQHIARIRSEYSNSADCLDLSSYEKK